MAQMTDKKECTKCNKSRSLVEFHNDKYTKDGKTHQCKVCRLKSSNKWKSKNTSRIKKTSKKWRQSNDTHLKEYNKAWRKENPDYGKRWYKENKDRHRELNKKWRKTNKEYIRQLEKEKLGSDIQFMLAYRLRKRLYQAIRNSYKSGSAVKDLGCTIDELKRHLESQFQPGMSWNNYGEWHIDHIIPLAGFDLTERQQFLEACHYTNLQPLWAKDNLKKGAKRC